MTAPASSCEVHPYKCTCTPDTIELRGLLKKHGHLTLLEALRRVDALERDRDAHRTLCPLEKP